MFSRCACGLVAALVVPLCGALAGEGQKASGKALVIGVSIPITEDFPPAHMKQGAEAEAVALGVKLVVADATMSSAAQVRDLRRFVDERVDGILLTPVPDAPVGPAIDAAAAAGIPVVKVLSTAGADKALLAIGVDAAQGGHLAARFVIERLGNQGAVILLDDPKGSSFHGAFMNPLDADLRGSNVKVLVREPTDWERDKAMSVARSLLERYPRFDAIIACTDDAILGAIAALRAAGIDPATKVTVGWDAMPEAVRSVRKGELTATLDQDAAEQGRQGLRYLVDYLRTRKLPPSRDILVAPKLISRAAPRD